MKFFNRQTGLAIGSLVFVLLAVFLGIKLEYDNQKAEKSKAEDLIVALETKKLSLIAQEQVLQNEARIESEATGLGYVNNGTVMFQLDVERTDVYKIREAIQKPNEY